MSDGTTLKYNYNYVLPKVMNLRVGVLEPDKENVTRIWEVAVLVFAILDAAVTITTTAINGNYC